ncbi:uncharacterized protein LOC130740460 isoform X2 [Lotus japonicus]|uniref:uncharacterized protein LOC130740460 isoform X2 n=1 Tax=Lotus japonicus TaxID=34305 RepID=UPI0025902E66|nr:uncharacterized protein LOC130740460 isoform X2 [Lotus japonicus]
MDSISDLPLLEIAVEDDSLLSDAPTSTNVFSCSPLISLRSLPPQSDGVDSENLNSSSKENSNSNRPEAPKLSVERSQMKRKKKGGGGYNLRKSLAWDRAFFTEQGVLNPVELSMISGTATPNMEVIQEEEPVATSLALQQIEENLFKHSSDGVITIGHRKNGAGVGLSPKPAALTKQTLTPTSMAKRKVLANNDVVGSASKRSACPRLVPSSSLKKPDMAKGPSKEVKVTRIPGRKSDLPVSTRTTARSGTLSRDSTKRNQNAYPGQSKNPRPVPSNPKADPAKKCSVTGTLTKLAAKQLNNSVSETHPPSRMYQPGSGANKSEACLPQGVSDTVEKKQQTLFQKTKSSGLRMPSPSLGYFSQSKASSSHSQLQKSSKPCNPAVSSIPKVRKSEMISINETRLPLAPRKRSEIIKGAQKNCSEGLSISDVKSEPSIQIENKQMVGAEVECDSLGSEKISNHVKVGNILVHVNLKYKEQEVHKSENVGSKEDVVLPLHENKLLSKSHTNDQLEEEIGHPQDEKLYDILSNGDQSLFQEQQSMDYNSLQRTSNNISNTMHNAVEQDEDEEIRPHACDVLTSNENLVLLAEHGASFENSRHSVELKEYSSVKVALLNSSLTDFSETALGGSIQGIPCKNTEQVDCGAGDFGKYGRDAKVHLLNGNLSVSCNEITQTNLDAVNQQLQGGQLKTSSPSIVGEISSKNENECLIDNCQLVHVAILASKISPQKSVQEINGATQSESQMTEIEDCHPPVGVQSGLILERPVDEEYDQVIDSKVLHDGTQSFELDIFRTVLTTACCTKVYDSPKRRPFCENNIENLNFTCPTGKADRYSGGSDMSISSCSPMSESQLREDSFSRETSLHGDVQRDVPGNFEQQASMLAYPDINEMLCEDESLVLNHGRLLHQSEISEVSVDFNSNTKDFIGHGAENPSGFLQGTELAQSVQEFEHTNNEIEEQQARMLANPEINDTVCADESVVPNHDHLFLQSEFSVSVDFISNTKDSIGKGAENPSGLLQHTELNQSAPEFEHINREIEESYVEDVQAQIFNENSVADNCNNKHGLSVSIDQLSLEDHNNIKEDSENVDKILHLDGDWLPADIASSEEISEKNLYEGAFEGCNIHISEHYAYNHHIQAMPENKDGNSNVDEKAELLQINDTRKVSSDISPLVEVLLNACDVNEHSASNHHIQAAPDNEDGNSDVDERAELLKIDDATKGASDIFPLVKVQLNASDLPEHNASNHHIPDLPENQDGNSDVDERAELLQIDDATKGASDILPLLEVQGNARDLAEHNASNHHVHDMPQYKDRNNDVEERAALLQIDYAKKGASDILPLLEVQLNDSVISADFDSSIKVSEDPFTKIDAWKSEDQCSLGENSKLRASDNLTFNARIPQGSEVSSLDSKRFSDEAETIFEKDDFPNTDMQHQTKGDISIAEDSNKMIQLPKSTIKSKQEVPALKPPPNAAPFSDEWLAALEAAGEEILTMKSGAVQNSPPHKPQHEPSPWSPVRRKSQAIGPFDCTKVTKHNVQHSG